jgi:hypothetical protein
VACDFDGRDQESIHDMLAVDVENGLENGCCDLVVCSNLLQGVGKVGKFGLTCAVTVRWLVKICQN